MVQRSGIITFKENEVHCLRMGAGPKLLIAFHGFGNDAGAFGPLAALMQEEYTIVAVDLPGHGRTQWKDPYLEKSGLMAIVQGIRNDFGAQKFGLLGYSMGARLALTVAELQPDWIDLLALLAPDGLEKNFWYNFATRNPAGKILFRKMLHRPEQWLHWADRLRRYRVLDESRFRFVRNHLTNEEVRRRLGYVWPVTSRLQVAMPLVKWNLRKQKIPIHVFMGKHDRIFPPAIGKRFVRNLKTARLHLLEAGHNLLDGKAPAEIATILKSQQNLC